MLGTCPPEKKKRVEKNKRTNANRVPEMRNPHFSLTVEVKKGDEGPLEGLRHRVERAKSLLGITRRTSSTQNADLLEALLDYFELLKPSAISAGSSSVATTSAISSPFEPVQRSPTSNVEPSASSRPRKRQINVDATVDDPFFVCTGESLKSLVKYFGNHSQCEFCGEEYNWSGMTFSKQGHVCRLEVPCVSNDSTVWLSSGILGHPAKYVVNVR